MADELHNGVAKWLLYMKPLTENAKSFAWTGSVKLHYFEILQRAAVMRQTEALEAILKMDDAGHAHFAVTFLRPSYEEAIWIKYLYQHPAVASELVYRMGFQETIGTLVAQNEHLGTKVMKDLGFTQRLIKIKEAEVRQEAGRLREIARDLKWKNNTTPSMAWLSRAVGRERDYKFLYHATSRFVHFSQQELLRRVWGKEGKVNITSNTFAEYWRRFALYWNFRLYLDLLLACEPTIGAIDLSQDQWREIKTYFEGFGPVPIITSRELQSW